MARYRAILFDLDDTLLKTYPHKWEQHKQAARQFYGVNLNNATLRKHWGKPTPELVTHLYGNADTPEIMVQAYRSLDKYYLKTLQVNTLEVIQQLFSLDYVLGVVTNAQSSTVLRDMHRLNLDSRLFSFIQTFDDTNAYKPDPRVMSLACRKIRGLGISRSETVYIGDSLIDWQTAKQVDMPFVGVTSGVTTATEFRQAGVTQIISTIEELLLLLTQ